MHTGEAIRYRRILSGNGSNMKVLLPWIVACLQTGCIITVSWRQPSFMFHALCLHDSVTFLLLRGILTALLPALACYVIAMLCACKHSYLNVQPAVASQIEETDRKEQSAYLPLDSRSECLSGLPVEKSARLGYRTSSLGRMDGRLTLLDYFTLRRAVLRWYTLFRVNLVIIFVLTSSAVLHLLVSMCFVVVSPPLRSEQEQLLHGSGLLQVHSLVADEPLVHTDAAGLLVRYLHQASQYTRWSAYSGCLFLPLGIIASDKSVRRALKAKFYCSTHIV